MDANSPSQKLSLNRDTHACIHCGRKFTAWISEEVDDPDGHHIIRERKYCRHCYKPSRYYKPIR